MSVRADQYLLLMAQIQNS